MTRLNDDDEIHDHNAALAAVPPIPNVAERAPASDEDETSYHPFGYGDFDSASGVERLPDTTCCHGKCRGHSPEGGDVKELPQEFAKVITENFWELQEKKERDARLVEPQLRTSPADHRVGDSGGSIACVNHPDQTLMFACPQCWRREWQPIASAPKDGTEVLLWQPTGNRNRVVGHKVGFSWSSIPGGYSLQPTFWMPLPPAPTEKRQ